MGIPVFALAKMPHGFNITVAKTSVYETNSNDLTTIVSTGFFCS
jgi:hypothetical protein